MASEQQAHCHCNDARPYWIIEHFLNCINSNGCRRWLRYFDLKGNGNIFQSITMEESAQGEFVNGIIFNFSPVNFMVFIPVEPPASNDRRIGMSG